MKILLINVDSKLSNIALHKIAMYYKGEQVIWDFPLDKYTADKIYVSCIYSKNKYLCTEWENIAEIGGSGYDLKKELPPEIELMKPLINIGFTSRGCIRNCKFCVVPIKEGKIRPVGDIYDFWDTISKTIIILDNNILALPEHFKLVISQIKRHNLIVDFNQGLDIRLINDDNSKLISQIKHLSEIRFAWDNIDDEKLIKKGLEIFQKYNSKRAMFYVLVGFNSTLEDDLFRFNKIKEWKQRCYCMRYEGANSRIYNDLASWVNQQQFFNSMTFNKFRYFRENRDKLERE